MTPISIVGIGCRLPGADGPADFWRLLSTGLDATGAPPPDRPLTRRGGYLRGIDRFDNARFGIPDREAAVMDPQQRLALEVTTEALDDAGIGHRATGSGAAVLFGACTFDHGIAVLGAGGHDAPFAVTGSALSIVANRISYALDLHGPSLVLDSACSSSLAAVDLAVRLLADPEVPFAVVGGVNLVLLPHTSEYLADGGFLAPDGRCKPFDAAADGYTRSDGCAVVVLQRTADAVASGARIYAEVAGSAVGSDGRSNGLYAPSGKAQQEVVRAAWLRAGVEPRRARYLECHGTGTPLGDAVEVGALAAVLGGAPVWLGSVKSNVGHLEAAAGVTGLIKTALAVRHGVIPPTLHVRTPNPLLRLAEHGLRPAVRAVDWSAVPPGERWAGVSSFGFGGTNAHVVLHGVAETEPVRAAGPVLIPLSGRDAEEVRQRAAAVADELAAGQSPCAGADSPAADSTVQPDAGGSATLPDAGGSTAQPDAGGFTAQLHAGGSTAQPDAGGSAERPGIARVAALAAAEARRLPEPARAAVLAADAETAIERLRALARSRELPGVLGPGTPVPGGVLFVFSGQGGQFAGMGDALAARFPAFAAGLAEATDAVVAAGGPAVWTPDGGFVTDEATAIVQPALFVYQIGMLRLLTHWGVRPDAVTGHSLGEVAAAVAAGALALGDAALVAVARGALLGRLDGHGAMAVLEAELPVAETLVEPVAAEVAVAAVNGPRSVVISGSRRYVDILLRRAKRRGLFARPVAVRFAAHSPQVAPVLPELRAALAGIEPLVPRLPLYSTARAGKTVGTADTDAGYWAENAFGTVHLGAALERAGADGFGTALEIAPHPVLLSAIRDTPAFADSAHATANRDDEVAALLECLGALHVAGRAPDWSALGPLTEPPPRRRWQRHRFPLLVPAPPALTEAAFPADDPTDHVVAGVPLIPAVYWLLRLLHAARARSGASAVRGFAVHELTRSDAVPAVTYREEAGGPGLRAGVTGSSALASTRSAGDPTPGDIVAWMRVVDTNRAARPRMRTVPVPRFYAELRERGLEYGPAFRPLRGLAVERDRAVGELDAADPHRSATLDGCLHVLAAAAGGLPEGRVPLPIGIENAWLTTEPGRTVGEAHALVRERSGAGLVGDVVATDQHGIPMLALLGVRVRFTDPELPVHSAPHRADVLRTEHWVPLPESAGSPPADVGRALVIGDSEDAVLLARALERTLPTERIARDPDAALPLVQSVLTGHTSTTRLAIVLVWPTHPHPDGTTVAALTRTLAVLQHVTAAPATATLTVLLPTEAAASTTGLHPAAALAGLVRSLQLESALRVRLVWRAAGTDDALVRAVTDPTLPLELRVAGTMSVRRFLRTDPAAAAPVSIDATGTYVVTGGLGALGSLAVRWLLADGARDVVVLTRAPRPMPAVLDGLEDRIVVVRCDVTDRADLAAALHDIREWGSTVRGIIHAAGSLEDAAFPDVTPEQLTGMLAAKATAAAHLLELTATDPTDFVLLFSSATGAFGAPGQAAYAAANSAMDALASAQRDRRVTSVGWGVWSSGLAEAAGGASHLRRAGIRAFDPERGAALFAEVLRHEVPYLLALDWSGSGDHSPVGRRLSQTLDDTAESVAPVEPVRVDVQPRPLAHIVRAALAAALDRPADEVDPAADFNDLGLTSLLGIELRRVLESRLEVRLSTAEIFGNPTVAALAAMLAERLGRGDPG
ncbi:type I polyketide synthase [Nocardia asteroides]|uniref:type I polyketide synthase n=1 Tax=Nocardia asteroides TaxID=1824 RepID=UPI001E5ECF6C|nr:type I polyketide synthase [Nocardia asteroides]UGT59223.1 SDR family NAD(P)-dependent oxidoreductase [Nocardia asteroides]